jgi:DNA-binding HxlR family transcriptional regulator
MKGYGQFCPVALGTEVFAERWTPLILRELLHGARRFADIHRGVPRISRHLLTLRLQALAHAGIIERKVVAARRGGEYGLTQAGREFGPVIDALGDWGYKWSTRDLRDEHLDPDYLMWTVRGLVRVENLPEQRVVVQFRFREHPKRRYWLILNRRELDLCIVDPGFDVDLEVVAETRALAEICLGHLKLVEATGRGRLAVTGPRQYCRDLAQWLGVTHFAAIAS